MHIWGAQESPQAPIHAPTHQPPLNHIQGELVGCSCQQGPHGCVVVSVEPGGGVGAGGAASSGLGWATGSGERGSEEKVAKARNGGLERLPQHEQQAQGQHHLCALPALHPSCHLQQDDTRIGGSGTAGRSRTLPRLLGHTGVPPCDHFTTHLPTIDLKFGSPFQTVQWPYCCALLLTLSQLGRSGQGQLATHAVPGATLCLLHF